MSIIDPGLVEAAALTAKAETNGQANGHANGLSNGHVYGLRELPTDLLRTPPSQETLRQAGWAIGEKKPAEAFTPTCNHVGLATVDPQHGFAHWRLLHSWIEQTAGRKGDAWRDCRMVVRLYDVSAVEFNGLNAHSIQDIRIGHLTGQLFFKLARPGTWQLAEVGFVLRNGEFLPAARSHSIHFGADAVSGHASQAALLVDERLRQEPIGSLWEQGRVLAERARPRLRENLRLASFAWQAPAPFVSGLSAGECGRGHEVHVFAPSGPGLKEPCQIDGVHYHPLAVRSEGGPIEQALDFARAAEHALEGLPPFDLFHVHEWMAGLAPWIGTRPTVLSLSSLETTRRGGSTPSELSQEVQAIEREVAHAADCLLTPDWLRERAITELALAADHVLAFPMEARLPNEWELPLDLGHVKMSIGFGPLDRLVAFIGPLEHAAGPDLLLESMPTLLGRCPGLRVVFIGAGGMHGHLERRMHELGLASYVRLLGHVEGPHVTRLMRAAEVLALPSRHRIAGDDGAVDLARHAGRPVVTTHAGPAHLVRHEENGILTYDNPGSMVWALERLLREPQHAENLGRNGHRNDGGVVGWDEVARVYLELCAATFPELTETRD